MNIFVGNLSFGANEDDVKKLFAGFGNVASVAIVMQKGKKTPKSRGFGFVDMFDEQQALAAIAALNGKEFMGRVLNVDPARPKTEAQAESGVKKIKDGRVRLSGQHLALKDRQVRPPGRPGTYKSGRRTRSYMSRLGLTGMQEEAKPRRRSQDNPMRWRKKKDQVKPWQKSPGEHQPWKKAEGETRPWKKAEGESKPWRKSEAGIKPWKKPAGDAKPWSKSSGRPQKSRFKGRRKPGGYGARPG
jgi:RNA recognition motif-containing protein